MPQPQLMATNDPKALLRRLLKEPTECEWLEFKHNNCDPDEIGRCVSACANASMLKGKDRAFIVWGIKDRTKQRLGTTVRLYDLKKGNEKFINWLIRMLDPRIMLEFIDFEDNGKLFSILTIDVTYDRPVKFAGTEYIRVGESIKPLKDLYEHQRALWMATGRRRFESAVALPHQSKEDVLSNLDVEGYYNLANDNKPKDTNEIIRTFMMLDFIKEDWEGGFDITNLGAILFARDLDSIPSVSGKTVRVVKYSGYDKRKSEGEIEYTAGYAIAFSTIKKYIMDALPKEELYRNGIRRLVDTYSEVAIRELLANALIHQDFTITGAGPLVEIYKDRVEIVNPGNSLIDKDRIIDERRSRNEKLAKAMRDLGICEERGSGIDKAIIHVEESFLPTPQFFPSQDSMRAVVFGPKSFASLSKADKIWSCFCHCVVRWLKHDYMSNSTLRERFSLDSEDYQTASAVIGAAKKAGRIIPADPDQGNRNARYVPYWAGDTQ